MGVEAMVQAAAEQPDPAPVAQSDGADIMTNGRDITRMYRTTSDGTIDNSLEQLINQPPRDLTVAESAIENALQPRHNTTGATS